MIIRVVVAVDHVLLRQGLRMLLGTEADIEVVAEADDPQSAIDQVLEHAPDVVLMDLDMPAHGGLDATRQLANVEPGVRVVALSGTDDESAVVSAMRAGAIGFVPKTATLEALIQTIRAAAQGRVTLSAAASARLAEELRAPGQGADHLTARELEVLASVAEGLSNKQIAWQFHISEKTVKSHVSTILSKFGLESRTQAALHATRVGLVSIERRPRTPVPPVERNIISLEAQRRGRRALGARSA